MGNGQLQGGINRQYDLFNGSWSLNFSVTYSGWALKDLQSHWGAQWVLLSDPAVQWQPASPVQPAQYALLTNFIAATWNNVGPLAIQGAVQLGAQWTDGQGAAVTVTPQLDLSAHAADWLHLQVGVQVAGQVGDHGVTLQYQAPATLAIQGRWTF